MHRVCEIVAPFLSSVGVCVPFNKREIVRKGLSLVYVVSR